MPYSWSTPPPVSPAQYVSQARMTIADLLAAFPANASRRGMLATVSDLYGALDATLRCGFDGTRYFWQPSGQPEYFNALVYPASGNIVLTGLTSPTIIKGSGTLSLGQTRTITLDEANLWPGARKRIDMSGVTSILGGLSILSGVVSLLSIVAGQRYDVAADFSSGSGKWVQI